MEEVKTVEQLKSENNMNFAKTLASELGSIDKMSSGMARKRIDTTAVNSSLQDPYKNPDQLQQQSENLRILNGTLKEIQFYKSNILTYDHYLLPIDASKYVGKKDKFYKDLRKASIELEKYNVKTLCRWLLENEIRCGEIYVYAQGTDRKTFFKIPNKMCKMTHYDNFISGYSIKLSDINDKTLGYFPTDIQKLFKKYKAGQLKNDKNFIDNYYKIDISKGVAFSPEVLEQRGIPYYSGLLLDLSRINDLSDKNMDNTITDNFKLVHQKLPSDKDTGTISIDYEEAMMYHTALKNELPEGVGGISTPYDIDSVTLGNNTNKNYDYLSTLRDNLFNGAGVDSSLFNNQNKGTAQAVVYSACVDTMLARNLLDKVKIWLNYDFQNNSALRNFRIAFCDTNIYDKEQKIAAACGRLATWGSKLEYLAMNGYSPLDALNLLIIEDVMELEEYMPPLMNSHTMSVDANENGRPSKQDETSDPNATSTSGEN